MICAQRTRINAKNANLFLNSAATGMLKRSLSAVQCVREVDRLFSPIVTLSRSADGATRHDRRECVPWLFGGEVRRLWLRQKLKADD